MPARSFRRFLLLVSALALVGSTLPLVPAAAAPPRDGQRPSRTYHPGRLGDPIVFETEDYFFHGQPTDAATKVVVPPTFDRTPPRDTMDSTQTASSLAADDVSGNPLGIYWRGPFTGTIDGPILLRTWWSNANPFSHLISVRAVVTLFADPDTDAEQIISQEEILIETGIGAVYNEHVIDGVEGTVQRELLIQIVPVFLDTGHGQVIHYDSIQFPSGFGIVTSQSDGGIVESRAARHGGPRLRMSFNYVGREAAEPTNGVTKEGTAFYAAGTFDALPQQTPRFLARTEVLRSDDGGRTWRSVQPRLPVGYHDDGSVDGDEHQGYTGLPPTTLDPYVYVDQDTGRVFNPELTSACIWLNYSDDPVDEHSWVTNPLACGDVPVDHQSLVTGPPPPGLVTVGYPNVVYYCTNRVAESMCQRSLDGGNTFHRTGAPPYLGVNEQGRLCGGLHGHITTDSEGRLFVPKGHCGLFGGFPTVAISEDGGTTWRRETITEKLTTVGHEVYVAPDSANNLYALWFSDVGEDRTLPWLATSTDHGRTWSEPMMVAPPGVAQVNFPTIDAGDPGRIAITFPGTRVADFDDELRPWDSYVAVSTNALDPDPVFLAGIANPLRDPVHRGDCRQRCRGMFDFLDIIIAPSGEFWATAVDTCLELPKDPCISGNYPKEEEPEEDEEEGLALFEVEPFEKAKEVTETHQGCRPVACAMEGVSIRQMSGPLLLEDACPPGTVRTPDGSCRRARR